MSEGKRIYVLDLFRGTAVILMVVYHMIYTFGSVFRFDFFEKTLELLKPFAPYFIATMFILICAYSCSLLKSNFKRGAQIFGIGLGISGVTIFVLPLIGIKGEGIYFGILHFLGIAVMLSPLIFKAVKKVPFYIGIPVLAALSIGMRDLTNKGFFLCRSQTRFQILSIYCFRWVFIIKAFIRLIIMLFFRGYLFLR